MRNSLFSASVKAGKTTYFVDVQVTKENKKYISITQSDPTNEEKWQRQTVRVFGQSAAEQMVKAMQDALNEVRKPITQP